MPLDVDFLVNMERISVLEFQQAFLGGFLGLKAHKGKVLVIVFVALDMGRLDLSVDCTDLVQHFFDFVFSVSRVLGLIRQVFDIEVLSGILTGFFFLKYLHGDFLLVDFNFLCVLYTFLCSLDGVELDVTVPSGFSVVIVTNNGRENTPELRKFLIQCLS